MLSLIALWIPARPLASSVTNAEQNHFCFYAHSKQDRTNWLSKCLIIFTPPKTRETKKWRMKTFTLQFPYFAFALVVGFVWIQFERKKINEIKYRSQIIFLSETSVLALEECALSDSHSNTYHDHDCSAFGEQWNWKFQIIKFWCAANNVRINEHKIAAICRYSLKLHFIYRKRLVYYPSFAFYSYL